MIRWLAEYSGQKKLTFLPLWNLTDVTVKKFTRGKNLTFLPPWGDKRGAWRLYYQHFLPLPILKTE